MVNHQTQPSDQGGWLEASGLLHIFRALGLAVQPAKLTVGLGAIIVTFLFGWMLDLIWTANGGVDENAIARFIQARELNQPYEEPEGEHGIFEVWRNHERRCMLGLLGSSIPGTSVAAGTPVGAYVAAHSGARPLRNFTAMVYGVWWLLVHHTLYSLVFGLGVLLIWSLAGGAMCRMAALQFARDDRLTVTEGLRYAKSKLFGGFFLAPCLPLIIVLFTAILMILGGILLRVPVVGDVIAGLAFPLAILGGFVITLLLLGLLVGGSFFWPAVAVEGSDAFDAFSRGLSYPFSKPWKWVLYILIAVIYASICWLFVNLFTYFMLKITRGVVAVGASVFGLWPRGEEGSAVNKIELLWPLGGPNTMYLMPDWSQLTWYEYISAALIGVYVLLVIGLMWSFLASFYYSGSTVLYYLLRRDVDGIDIDDVYVEEAEEEGEFGMPPATDETAQPASETPPAPEGAPGAGPAPQPAQEPLPSPGTDQGRPEEPPTHEGPSSETDEDRPDGGSPT